MRNQRRHKRYDVEDVTGSLMYHLDARVLNMSLTGMAIETASLLKVGGNYQLRIPHEDDVIRFTTDVRWCRLVRTQRGATGDSLPVYHAGLDFRGILDEKARQVLEFIERNVIVEVDRRIFGRFKLLENDELAIDASHEFLVHRISLSGMLIETDLSPAPDEVFAMEIRPNGSPIEVRGRVANIAPVGDGDRSWQLGIEFVKPSSESRRALEALIEGLLE